MRTHWHGRSRLPFETSIYTMRPLLEYEVDEGLAFNEEEEVLLLA